jgi:hypothetical protein
MACSNESQDGPGLSNIWSMEPISYFKQKHQFKAYDINCSAKIPGSELKWDRCKSGLCLQQEQQSYFCITCLIKLRHPVVG